MPKSLHPTIQTYRFRSIQIWTDSPFKNKPYNQWCTSASIFVSVYCGLLQFIRVCRMYTVRSIRNWWTGTRAGVSESRVGVNMLCEKFWIIFQFFMADSPPPPLPWLTGLPPCVMTPHCLVVWGVDRLGVGFTHVCRMNILVHTCMHIEVINTWLILCTVHGQYDWTTFVFHRFFQCLFFYVQGRVQRQTKQRMVLRLYEHRR